jgi:Arc/MetJ-type ribon-helix-helix transcriptional regulator
VQLDDRLLGLLDARAARDEVSRSHVIRQAVELLLDTESRARIDRDMVEGYTRVPQAGDDLQGFRDFSASERSRRLAKEEGLWPKEW